MRIKIFNSTIIAQVSLTVVAILVLCVCFAFFVIRDISKSIEHTHVANTMVNQNNKNFEKITQLKLILSQTTKNISYTSWQTQQIVHEHMYKIEIEREKMWDKKIMPTINDLSADLETNYNDEVKVKFHDWLDDVLEVRKKQRLILENRQESDVFQLNKIMLRLYNRTEIFMAIDKTIEIELSKSFVVFPNGYTFITFIAGVIFIFIFFLIIQLIKQLRTPIIQLNQYATELNNGNFPTELDFYNEDYRPIARSLNFFSKKLYNVKEFAVNVGQGKFEDKGLLKFSSDGELGQALSMMQHSLSEVAEADEQRKHINEGLAKFSEILSNNTNNLEHFGDEVVLNLVKFLNANQGAFFVVNDENKADQHLSMIASYAYNKKKFVNKKILKGQGLVGQAWIERKPIYLTQVPDDYVNITSGLGQSTPKCILIVPLIFNEHTQGVIELASFKNLKDYELGFVERVSESISSALASVKVNVKTHLLLKRSEELTQKMKLQEDEMRRSVDELRLTQEESQRREEQNLREIRRLKKRLQEYERNF